MTPSRALARVNLAAIERNCALLRSRIGDSTELCAVVKANGYGHGAVQTARAAQAGGAGWLAVAAAREAAELRAAGIGGPLLVLGALSGGELEVALDADADVVVWSAELAERASAGARARGIEVGVHLKLDVGMGRLGTRDPDELLAVGRRVLELPGLRLAGAMTHFPCADEDLALTRQQLAAFTAFGARLRELAPDLLLHAANSPAALGLAESRLDMVRCGIAIYGLDPWGRDPAEHGLEAALELRSHVAALKPIAPGQTVGYGATFTATEPGWIATLPIGYGDGFRRAFSNNGVALLGGRRRPLVGRVSMDNVCVDVGPDPGALRVGDPVVLIGAMGEERITAEELAALIGTINYEITTALSERVVWEYHVDGDPVDG
ncbi:alanine racemase [Conexibacter stalactiti]|uniref:Alanine racemase n=1 Tax=Conexibacter stalactiti TaxID=1940611 RepID=A0ABU4HL03_9ACTN|nr:alanine racemase [Conexibacter stalactiti]MDW5593952.1 alanine racemase [Conexibacter stalactiti]MEC5034594.1 alanine racemase [Conexibacter stalactiti]